MNPFLPFLLTLLLTLSCDPVAREARKAAAESEVTTFILVRHAEKDFGDDPVLTAEGTARAERLRDMLKETTVHEVYTTDTRRTRLTAQPTAEAHQLEAKVYRIDSLEGLASRLRNVHAGQTVLIVGHSNTTPELANYLAGSRELDRFSELDYGNLLVVTVPPTGNPRVLKLRY
ncbi:histidine phosphatase family protein [Lewinella sp. JB7]|uniref:SixA phosphatase family protein n=1 Tax=Lewinella sp. JB7 TaxID=2962887 RepID=UPI0020C9F1E3|nr:phosphoglycerate mutase family protein [Lewinella sp. JB7]MCP9235418.1 histidine phosphatase family protein [Lewinella sp. JB7]